MNVKQITRTWLTALAYICLGTISFAATDTVQRPIAPAGSVGLPVDRNGGPTVDPTMAVRELVIAAVKRLDDLHDASDQLNKERASHLKEIAELRAAHEKEQRASEAARLDSIRQVDRDDVSKTAASANIAIATLANRTTDLQTTLAKQVQDTATAVEVRQSAFATEVNKRLSALELTSSERQGKQTVADPQLEKMNAAIEKLAALQSSGAGKSEGMSNLWVLITGGIVLLVVLYSAFTSRANGKILKTGRSS